jgi:hypothetical protein
MEERQRAIAAAKQAQAGASSGRSRQPSPSPGARVPLEGGSTHRRDRSRGPETRFPVATPSSVQSPATKHVASPTSSTSSKNHRDSLTVPQSPPPARQTATSTNSPPKSQPEVTSPPAQDPPRTNGSIHQPPPAENDSAVSYSSTGRDRSGTESSKKISVQPTMSASLSGPQDFVSPSHYYSGSIDSPTASGSATQSPVTGPGEVKKADSLSRNRAQYTRKPAADSASVKSGVQLEDRPVDFD